MAVVLCRKCFQKFPTFKSSFTNLLLRYLAAQSAQTNLDDTNVVVTAETSEHTRDKLKVLTALAATIQPVPNAPMHGFFEDPFLMPRTSTRKNEFLKAREEGKKAAEYVIQTYPGLFPLRKAEPEWPKELPVHIKGESEKTLLNFISAKQTKRAINLYEKLLSNGKPVSLECENKLLEFTGYYGIIQQLEPREEQSGNKNDQEIKVKNKWSSHNYADKLFKKMSTKNGRTYEIMILSLLKFQSHKRASNLFNEMKEKDFKGDVFFYNQLINNSEQLCMDKKDPWSFAQDIIELMNTKPFVQPNVGTFKSLLKISGVHSTEPYENGLRLIREMYSLQLEPSFGCYTYLLEAAEKNGQGHGAVIDIVGHLKSLDHRFLPESTKDYDFFVNAMATSRHFRDGTTARQLFKLAESNNFKAFLGQRPLSFYGNLLCSLALSEHANTVMNVYHELVPKYFVPREWIYVELLRCVERSKQPHKAIELYNDIKHHRVNMTVYTCRSLVSCFSVKLAKEHLPEYVNVMEEIFKWMEFFDVELDDFMRSQLIRIYCLNGQMDNAWERLESFSKTNFMPTFAALSSLLQGTLSTKEKNKAQQIFQIMANQGFRLNASLRNSYYRELHFTAEECYKVDQLFTNLASRR